MDFDVESKIKILKRSDYSYIKVLNYDGVISKNNGSYMFFSKHEKEMFELLNDNTILETLKKFYLKNNCTITEEECIVIVENLLRKINDAKFYDDYIPEEQDNNIDSFRTIQINLTNNCNLRCLHCFLSAGYQPLKQLQISDVIKLANLIKENGLAKEIVISGGESLVYKDLESVLKAFTGCSITLFTNGTLINECNAYRILPLVDEVQISFEGLTKEYYELVRGKGNYEKVINAIELVKKFNKKITLAITVLPDTLTNIEENIISFVKTLNYSNIEIRINDDLEIRGNAINLKNKKIDKLECAKRVGKILKRLQLENLAESNKPQQGIRFLNCGIGSSVIINFDGKIYPCYKEEKIFNTINDDFVETLKKFVTLNESTSIMNIESCSNCNLKYICCGGCKVENYTVNGDCKVPICNKQEKLENILFQYIKAYGMD